jgi:hypothetical protein
MDYLNMVLRPRTDAMLIMQGTGPCKVKVWLENESRLRLKRRVEGEELRLVAIVKKEGPPTLGKTKVQCVIGYGMPRDRPKE